MVKKVGPILLIKIHEHVNILVMQDIVIKIENVRKMNLILGNVLDLSLEDIDLVIGIPMKPLK